MKFRIKQADGTFVEKEMEVADGLNAVVAAEVAPLTSKIATLETENAALAVKVKAFEDSPAIQRTIGVGQPKMHKGYNIRKQMIGQRHLAAKNPELFPAFNDEQETDEYIKGMIEFVAGTVGKDTNAFADMVARNKKALQGRKAAYAEGANATGGYLIAPEFLWDLVKLAKSNTFMLNAARIIPMSAMEVKVPTELTRANGTWDVEGAVTESEGTFDQVTLTAKRFSAYSIASNEMLQDEAMDIVAILNDQFSYGTALELDNQVLNGTGAPVSGLTTATVSASVVLGGVVNSGSTNWSSQTAAVYSEAIYTLNEGDANRARFFINKISKHYLRGLKDANGQPIFVAPGAQTPGTIYETPYNVSETLSNVSSAAKCFGVLGNFDYYFIGRRLAFSSIEVDPYGKFAEYQTRFRMASRWAFKIARNNAFVRMMSASS